MKENFVWQPLIGVSQCILDWLYICCTVAGKILENCSVKPHAAWGVCFGVRCACLEWGDINPVQCPLVPELTRMMCILIFKAKLHSLSLRILYYRKVLAMLSSVQEVWCFRAC